MHYTRNLHPEFIFQLLLEKAVIALSIRLIGYAYARCSTATEPLSGCHTGEHCQFLHRQPYDTDYPLIRPRFYTLFLNITRGKLGATLSLLKTCLTCAEKRQVWRPRPGHLRERQENRPKRRG